MFRKRDKPGPPPFLGSLLTSEGKQQPIRRKLQLKLLNFHDDKLTLEMILLDFEKRKLAYESADRTIVSISSEFDKRVKVELKLYDLKRENFEFAEATIRHGDVSANYTSVPMRQFKEWLEKCNNNNYDIDVQMKEFHETVENANTLKIFLDDVMKIKLEKSSQIARNIDDLNKIKTSLYKYLINKCNKLTEDWIRQTRLIINDILTARDKLRFIKRQVEQNLRQLLSTNQFDTKELKLELINNVRDKYIRIYKNKDRSSNYTKYEEEAVVKEATTVLLLGPVSSGKTTLINSLSNYVKYANMADAQANPITVLPMEFTVVDSNNTSAVIRCGDKRATSDFKQHSFNWRDNVVKFIDTPGFDNTTEHFVDNIEYYLKETSVDVVCVVVDALYCNVEWLEEFVKQSAKFFNRVDRVLFCYTNTATCFYNTGDNFNILVTLLKKLNVKSRTSSENVFCFDNEAYRYLCALKYIKFKNFEVEKFGKSWTVSSAECRRLFDYICPSRQEARKSTQTIRTRQASSSSSNINSVLTASSADRGDQADQPASRFSRFLMFGGGGGRKVQKASSDNENSKNNKFGGLFRTRRHSVGSQVKSEKMMRARADSTGKQASLKSEKVTKPAAAPVSVAAATTSNVKPTPKQSNTIDVLVVGPHGSGKTTLINSIINYIQFNDLTQAEGNVISVMLTSFTIKGNNNETLRIQCGDDDSTDVCNFAFDDHLYRMIDTPGLRALKNKGLYIREINRCTNKSNIRAICVVLSLAQDNWSEFFPMLPKLEGICDNFVYCITNTGTGNNLSARREILKQYTTDDCVYCYESEAYHYLCSLEHVNFSQQQKDKCKIAWETSSMETRRMLTSLKQPGPPTKQITANVNTVNILVVGPSGCGKTTFVNSLLNYLTYNKLSEAESNLLTLIPSQFNFVINSKNIVKVDCPRTTENNRVTINNITYKLIDTPGYDSKDENYMTQLKQHTSHNVIHVVCIVLKSNENNESVLTNFLKQVPQFHTISQNILFCFTHCSDNLYTKGSTLPILLNSIKEMGAPITVSSELIYRFDNDCYRYLCALKKLKFTKFEIDSFNKSWTKSKEETARLINVCSRFNKKSSDAKEEHELDVAVIKSYVSALVPRVDSLLISLTNLIDKKNKFVFNNLQQTNSTVLVKKTIKANIMIDPIYFCVNQACPNSCIKSKTENVWEVKVLKSQHCKLNLLSKLATCSTCHCSVKDHVKVDAIEHKQELELPITVQNNKQEEEKNEIIQQITVHQDNISKTIDDVANLNNYLHSLEGDGFVDELNVKLSNILEDTTLDNSTYIEEVIKAKQYYQRTSKMIVGDQLSKQYLQHIDDKIKQINGK